MTGGRVGAWRSGIGVDNRLGGAEEVGGIGRAGVDARLCAELEPGGGVASTGVGGSDGVGGVAGMDPEDPGLDGMTSSKVSGVGGSIPGSNSEILKVRGE